MRLPRTLVVLLMVGWMFVALYPDPSLLARSIANIRQPDVDPLAVQDLAATLPDDPQLIEQAVLYDIMPYAYDWQSSGVPWYFPTVSEALASKQGDCESRAVVLASLLDAKGIPYNILMSFDHIWVDYPGKVDNALENPDLALATNVDGDYSWNWPTDFDLGDEIKAQIATFWTPMPTVRRLLFFAGLLLILMVNPVLSRFRCKASLSGNGGVHPFWRSALQIPRQS